MGGWIIWWVGWGLELCQITNNQINGNLIEIIQLSLTIFDMWSHSHLWVVGGMDILTFCDILLKPPQPFTGLFFEYALQQCLLTTNQWLHYFLQCGPFAHLGRTPLHWRFHNVVVTMCRKECDHYLSKLRNLGSHQHQNSGRKFSLKSKQIQHCLSRR